MKNKFSAEWFVGTLVVVGLICWFFIASSDYDEMMIRLGSAWVMALMLAFSGACYAETRFAATGIAPKYWGSIGWALLVLSVTLGMWSYHIQTTTSPPTKVSAERKE